MHLADLHRGLLLSFQRKKDEIQNEATRANSHFNIIIPLYAEYGIFITRRRRFRSCSTLYRFKESKPKRVVPQTEVGAKDELRSCMRGEEDAEKRKKIDSIV